MTKKGNAAGIRHLEEAGIRRLEEAGIGEAGTGETGRGATGRGAAGRGAAGIGEAGPGAADLGAAAPEAVGRGEPGLGEVVVPEDPDDPTVVGEVSDRRVLAAGAVLIGICAGFIAYGFLGGDEGKSRSAPTAVTAPVTDADAVHGEPSARRH
ncbi:MULTISPECIES: hypothetical protein [Streptomyces]|uniref:hypothetical protein n=1 Tax=Streptomyces TaxID=1883 RepID=UPI001E508713|nr:MULTISPECIES: hypothetical protein [Streptomyces]UFQ17609.1 hypothetical protein J2N69_22845 [Streptomyces huasconensis]WCL87214.1 hypothetical protein PPN52_22845 [Streptomyces sp. JCM 35825]